MIPRRMGSRRVVGRLGRRRGRRGTARMGCGVFGREGWSWIIGLLRSAGLRRLGSGSLLRRGRVRRGRYAALNYLPALHTGIYKEMF